MSHAVRSSSGHYSNLDELRAIAAPRSMPTSPRATYRQLARPSADYHSLGVSSRSPPTRRSPSAHSQLPLPHQHQAHFYGVPELDFGMFRSSTKPRGQREGTCCSFDKFSSSNYDVRDVVTDVLLVGLECGLDVYSIDRKRFERIGHLAELRGTVLQATILPPVAGQREICSIQPLVAVIVHGPGLVDSSNPQEDGPVFDDFEAPAGQTQPQYAVDPSVYQTTVDVYSLKTGEHVQTLLRCAKVENEVPIYGSTMRAPPPSGDLSVEAKGRFLSVSSGKSGEVYLFASGSDLEDSADLPFRSIGKVWTRTTGKTNRSASTPSSGSEFSGLIEGPQLGPQITNRAVISLSSRWLAYMPPPSSSQTTIHASLMSKIPGSQIHGVTSHAPPAEPYVTCNLDMPDAESFLNKVARDGAQTFLKGAQWVGTQGLQAWNNYWTKPSEQAQQPYSTSYPQGALTQQAFPPTHAPDVKTSHTNNQASIISIIDLEKLAKGQNLKTSVALEPAATFTLPAGCSLLSFTPDGLRLLTASTKGDVQQVWDLMRMIHGEPSQVDDMHNRTKMPTVREVARYTRMTEAKIIDVVWTEPQGARFAMVTDKGTIHINDLPDPAFHWPPPKRTARNARSPSQTEDSSSAETSPSQGPSTITSAIGALSSSTQPILAAVRGRRPSIGSSFSAFGGLTSTAGYGAKGGKAVVAGVNRSVSAAATGAYNTITHLGENRIALPASVNGIVPGCVHWLTGRDRGSLAVIGGANVKVYGVSKTLQGKRRPSVLGEKPTEYILPVVESPAADEHDLHHPPSTSFWRHQSRPTSRSAQTSTAVHPLSFAEIETRGAYQPFHVDSRITLLRYEEDPAKLPWGNNAIQKTRPDTEANEALESDFGFAPSTRRLPPSSQPSSPWVFGKPIATTKIGSDSGSAEDELATEPKMPDVPVAEPIEEHESSSVTVQALGKKRKNKASKKATNVGADTVVRATQGADGGKEIFEEGCEVLDVDQ